MELTGLTTATSAAPTNAGPASKELGKDVFMQLLVEQMKTQDPMNPQSNEDFIAQLASFSSLEQMEQLNENVLGMAMLDQGNALLDQLTNGSALIGKEVHWTDPSTGLSQRGVVDALRVEDGTTMLGIGGQDVPLFMVSEVALAAGAGETDSTGEEA